MSIIHQDAQEVAEDVIERGKKYGFKQDADSVHDAVIESANLLNIELTAEQSREAADHVLEHQ